MTIETVEIIDSHNVVEVKVILRQNGASAEIGNSFRLFTPDWEPLEETHARALKRAADWLTKGPVDLRDTSGQYVART